jgi:anti-sigma-K factor RskA
VSRREHDLECPQTADAAAYVLGALDEGESDRYRLHLDTCAVCRYEVDELRPAVDLLSMTSPAVQAPPELRDRLMAVVNSEAELLRAAGHEADRASAGRSRWRPRPIAMLAGTAALALGVAVGALVIDTGSGTGPTRQVQGVAPAGAQAVLRQSGGRSELDVANLAQPPAGRIYQVWVQRGSQNPVATDALFGVNHGHATVSVPGNLRGARQVMVTAEPMGGNVTGVPSTQPVISVRLTRS